MRGQQLCGYGTRSGSRCTHPAGPAGRCAAGHRSQPSNGARTATVTHAAVTSDPFATTAVTPDVTDLAGHLADTARANANGGTDAHNAIYDIVETLHLEQPPSDGLTSTADWFTTHPMNLVETVERSVAADDPAMLRRATNALVVQSVIRHRAMAATLLSTPTRDHASVPGADLASHIEDVTGIRVPEADHSTLSTTELGFRNHFRQAPPSELGRFNPTSRFGQR